MWNLLKAELLKLRRCQILWVGLVGGVGLFATLLSVYGFIMGLLSFSEEGRSHKTSIIGSISNGLFLIVWIGVYLTGL